MPPIKQRELVSDNDTLNMYIGIDPGEAGAMVILWGQEVQKVKIAGLTDSDLWLAMKDFGGKGTIVVHCCIEQQTPRPTKFFKNSKWESTILASTCILYGRYQQAKSFLIAAAIPFEDVPPRRWQKGLHIPDRPKGINQTEWKNVLKSKAQQLFPEEKVTLATADALLLAEYCRRYREGKL